MLKLLVNIRGKQIPQNSQWDSINATKMYAQKRNKRKPHLQIQQKINEVQV